MRLVLDLTPFVTTSAMRGIGRYVHGLVQGLHALSDDDRSGVALTGLVADPALRRLSVVDDVLEYTNRPVQPPVARAGARRARLITFEAPSRIAPDQLLHLTDPKGIPLSRTLRYCLTSHDLISLALPDLYLPPVPGWTKLYAGVERLRYGKVQRVLAVSHATRRDVCTMLGYPEALVDVVYHGVDHARFHPEEAPGEAETIRGLLSSSEPYLLYLGAGDARKDLDTLARAYAQSRARKDARLVIAGRHDPPRVASLSTLIASLGQTGRILQLGYVAEEHIPALYRRARVHAFVSRYEGFGLPVLEALACGTPTITSPGSSLDEVAGDAALVVPCGDVGALATALDTLFYDDSRRDDLRQRGLARARTFTWERCAREHLAFWRRAEVAAR